MTRQTRFVSRSAARPLPEASAAYDLIADPGETNNLVRAGASLPKEAQDLIPHLKPNEK